MKQNSALQSNASVVSDEHRISVFYINPIRCIHVYTSVLLYDLAEQLIKKYRY